MKLNLIEYAAMNSKIRAIHQEKIEMMLFKSLSNLEPNKKVLEIGCGNGYGTFLIHKYFKPKEIQSIDLDNRMINKAKKRYGNIASFKVASVTNLPFPDEEFDAVINFGIIHHIPNWRDAIKECSRVLKSGGQLISEDLSIETWEQPFAKICKILLKHPYEKMFNISKFKSSLIQNHLNIHSLVLNYRFIFPFFTIIAIKR